jgi:DNA phosphorothioation-dependent restriction protein DptH
MTNTERVTLHRHRKRLGLRPVIVLVSEQEIEFLLARDYQLRLVHARGSRYICRQGRATVGRQSSEVLGNEILKYIECHDTSRLLHIHALRPGDGLTVARSLGHVQRRYQQTTPDDDLDEDEDRASPAFVLELYPSHEQRGVAGRFIAEAREKRRSGAGVLSAEDRWMLESLSLPRGMNLPRLRWARKSDQDPETPAHIALAFDTFESRVVPDQSAPRARPPFAYGLPPCWPPAPT